LAHHALLADALGRGRADHPGAWPMAGPHARSITDDDRQRQQTPIDNSMQNNIGPLGGPVQSR